jgi:hypothetical protein
LPSSADRLRSTCWRPSRTFILNGRTFFGLMAGVGAGRMRLALNFSFLSHPHPLTCPELSRFFGILTLSFFFWTTLYTHIVSTLPCPLFVVG